MKILFRCDSNQKVAMGHVMRCLSVADALRDKGVDVVFVCASNDPMPLMLERGYYVHVLDTAYNNMDSEFPLLDKIIEIEKPDRIVVDTYYTTDSYLDKLREYCPVGILDDFGNKPFHVDFLINYNIFADRSLYATLYRYAGLKLPLLILSPAYAPLRKEFQNVPEVSGVSGLNYLLTVGGSDNLHVCSTVVRKFLDSDIEGVTLHVLKGPFFENAEDLKNLADTSMGRVVLHEPVKEMAKFLSGFDFCVSAAGSTTYELCSLGIPSALFCTADNQVAIHNGFKAEETMPCLGLCFDEFDAVTDRIISTMKEASTNRKFRKDIKSRMKKITDGNGAILLADRIISLK